jgi:hypothetical protein
MTVQALELGHERSNVFRSFWDFDIKNSFHSLAVTARVGMGTDPANPLAQENILLVGFCRHQFFDAAVYITGFYFNIRDPVIFHGNLIELRF